MDITQLALLVIVIQALVIVALLLVVTRQGGQLGSAYPADVKSVLGALAGLAAFFALKSDNKIDDSVVNGVLLPIFKLLGIEAVPLGGTAAPMTINAGPNSTVNAAPTVTPPG